MRIGAVLLALVFSGWTLAAQTDLANVVQLSARGDHACVVTASGVAKCWGANSSGQLGAGPLAFRNAAADVVGLSGGVVAVAAALGGHSCALLADGTVQCWGANYAGQLGNGTTTGWSTPVAVQGLPLAATAVSGGASHTCALLADRTVACWGSNNYGQLGDGTKNDRLTPVIVPGLAGVVAISAGTIGTCALLSTGSAKCWGYASAAAGSLDSGITSIESTGTFGLNIFAVPSVDTCATTDAGGVQCWGMFGNTPTDVPGAANAIQVTTAMKTLPSFGAGFGIGHSCLLAAGGIVKCWGSNYCGALGDGSAPECGLSFPSSSTPVDVAGLPAPAVSVSAQSGGPTCALLNDGHVRCWGGSYGGSATPAVEGTSQQTISFNAPPVGMGVDGTGTVTATGGGSGNNVIFSVLTPTVCSIMPMGTSTVTVTGLAGGTCTIAANQAGDAYFDAAPQATLNFPIDPRHLQRITHATSGILYVNGVVQIIASSDSGLPVELRADESNCTMTGTIAKGLLAGSCGVVATQAGDANYLPANEMFSIPILSDQGMRGLAVYKWGAGEGTVTSAPAGIDCGASCAAVFPQSSTVTLTATPASNGLFGGWMGACSGTGPCTVTMDQVKTVSANFSVAAPHIANLSTRGVVGFGNDVLIGGFVIAGSEPKTVVVRARGWSLLDAGVTNPVRDPLLQLVRSSDQATIAVSADARTDILTPNVTAQKRADMRLVEALGFMPSESLESALIATLAPGAYTAIVSHQSPPTRALPNIGLFEIFEIDNIDSHLINVSTRGMVQGGEGVLIGGFIIQGTSPQTVVVRARGPSLAAAGVANALADTLLQLVRSSDQAIIGTNDDWQSAANASDISASGFQPLDTRESAIMMTLPPGAYTAIVSGTRGATGTGIVEVFRVGN